MESELKTTADLAASITRGASSQSYYTVRLLADPERKEDAFRAYAYFRWVDDCLDQGLDTQSDRLSFVGRELGLIEDCYQHKRISNASSEERMLVDLIQSNPDPNSGLACYIRNLMAVMAFDSRRRGRLISEGELKMYTDLLAVAVTEALHYFIGHGDASPHTESRYLAVTGAHVTHMLRDTWEDNRAGYFNIPQEYLEENRISPLDVQSRPYRAWVQSRVDWARGCFDAGSGYLAQVENLRYRLACYAYTARFVSVLDSIEQDRYLLRPEYRGRKGLGSAFRMSWSILSSLLKRCSHLLEPEFSRRRSSADSK